MTTVSSPPGAAGGVAPPKPPLPNRHRMALLVLIGVYPLITALLYALAPLTSGWAVWHRTLILAPLMVVFMVYGLIPFIQLRFRAFLSGGVHRK